MKVPCDSIICKLLQATVWYRVETIEGSASRVGRSYWPASLPPTPYLPYNAAHNKDTLHIKQ